MSSPSVKPCRRDEGVCHLDLRKLHLRHDQGRKRRGKHIEFDVERWCALRGVAAVKLWIFDGDDISLDIITIHFDPEKHDILKCLIYKNL